MCHRRCQIRHNSISQCLCYLNTISELSEYCCREAQPDFETVYVSTDSLTQPKLVAYDPLSRDSSCFNHFSRNTLNYGINADAHEFLECKNCCVASRVITARPPSPSNLAQLFAIDILPIFVALIWAAAIYISMPSTPR